MTVPLDPKGPVTKIERTDDSSRRSFLQTAVGGIAGLVTAASSDLHRRKPCARKARSAPTKRFSN